jgi:hypothetical protein
MANFVMSFTMPELKTLLIALKLATTQKELSFEMGDYYKMLDLIKRLEFRIEDDESS